MNPESAIDHYKSDPLIIVVDNVPGAVTDEQWLPAVGQTGQRSRWTESFAVDWVLSTDTPFGPHGYSYPYEFANPPEDDEERDALFETQYVSETWLQVWNTRYDVEGRLSQTEEGHRFIDSYNIYNAEEKTKSLRLPFTDGLYNQASVNKETFFYPDLAGPGFFGISFEGRLFHIHPTNGVTTLAGHVTRSDVVPYGHLDYNVSREVVAENTYEIVGDFGEDSRFNLGRHGLIVDPSNPTILYVSDTGHHAIRKVDLSGAEAQITTLAGTMGVSGHQDGDAEQALFNYPMGVEIVDGVLYVADRGNNALRAVNLTTGNVTTLLSDGITILNMFDDSRTVTSRSCKGMDTLSASVRPKVRSIGK